MLDSLTRVLAKTAACLAIVAVLLHAAERLEASINPDESRVKAPPPATTVTLAARSR